jgi:fatty acid desaturase
VGIAAGFTIGMLVRGIGSIGHDAAHGLVSKNKLVAYLVGVAAWSATLFSFTLYRAYHLDHHKIVNRPNDIDRVQVSRFTSNLRIGRAMRLAIYMGLYPFYWMQDVQRYKAHLTPMQRVRVWFEFIAIYAALASLYPLMGPVAFFSVVGTQTVVGAVFASLTSMAEHYGIAYDPDHAYSSRTYGTGSVAMDFFWSGTPYHNEHHKFPGIPYYNLRSFHLAALQYYSPRVRENVHTRFWPLIASLLARAARQGLDEERASADRDRARIASENDDDAAMPVATAAA